MKVFVSSALVALALSTPGARADLPASVTALIDASVDPCDNFYQYACGGWFRKNSLAASDYSKDALFAGLTAKSDQVIQDFANEDWPLVGEFWDSCRDTATIDALGIKVIDLRALTAATGFAQVMRVAGDHARTLDKPVGLRLGVGLDPQDGKTAALQVDRAALTLPVASLYNKTGDWWAQHGAGYRKYIATLLKLSKFTPKPMSTGGSTDVDPNVMADAVIALEASLAAVPETAATPSTMPLSTALQRWPSTLGVFVTGAAVTVNSKVTSKSNVIFRDTNYIDALDRILLASGAENVKTYIAFRLLHDRVQYLSTPFVDAYTAFFVTELNETPPRAPRESFCIDSLKQLLPGLVGKHYTSKALSKDGVASAESLVKELGTAMSSRLVQNSVNGDATWNAALTTLGNSSTLVGQSTVKRSYAFSLARDTFYANVQAARDGEFLNKLAQIGAPLNRDAWTVSPADVAPAYSTQENKLMLPAAFLQAPFFSGASVHPAQKFGSAGVLVAREWARGLDAAFAPQSQCLATQYSSFAATSSETGKPLGAVDGTLTLAENVADNAGFAFAWEAYKAAVTTGSFDAQGVSATEADQLFFLSNAQTLCRATRDAGVSESLRTSAFAPAEWRANGVAINSEQFASTFMCRKGSRMNPATKCPLW